MDENSHLILNEPQQYKGIWGKSVFQNSHPVHVEIGTGKGQFITEMATRHPDINFIGIEISKSVIVTAAEKILNTDVDNVYLMQINAEDIMDIFAENEVAVLYLNFSDPWPKNRHEKRRLTFHTFLDKYRYILRDNGEIMMKTDNQNLFEYSLVSFSQAGMMLSEVNLNLHEISQPEHVVTEYEERFIQEGKPIYHCIVQL